jgi:glycosyltransferase involved in cell wall biosynthesis
MNKPNEITGKRLPSICFVAQNAFGALSGRVSRHIGGIEHQQALMSRWLASRGFPVSMVTFDEGQRDGLVIDGVTVFKTCRKDAGLPGIKFFAPRWTSLWAALSRANADIYYYNCGDLGLGQVVLWARLHGKKVIYTIANDIDCYKDLPALKQFREKMLYRFGLTNANKIVVQTNCQQKLLKQQFSLDSIVVPMPSRGLPTNAKNVTGRVSGKEVRIVWIGRFTEVKRPHWILQMAKSRPDWKFEIVGSANSSTKYSAGIMAEIGKMPNIAFHGNISQAEIGKLLEGAAVLCGTSSHEGFPNIYLEAWSVGIPVVTTFDPDGVIQTHGLGRVADSVEGLIRAINELVANPDKWENASKAGYEYFSSNHSVEKVLPRFENVFLELSQASIPAQGASPIRSRPDEHDAKASMAPPMLTVRESVDNPR